MPSNPAYPGYLDDLEAFKQRAQPSPFISSSGDPIADAARMERVRRVQSDILAGGSPDAMARTVSVARQLGVLPTDVEGLVDHAETSLRARGFANLIQAHPDIGTWADGNPRGAVAASDDTHALGILGTAWGVAKSAATSVAGAANQFAREFEGDPAAYGVRPSVSIAAPLEAGTAALLGDPQAQAALPSARRAVGALGAGAVRLPNIALKPAAWLLDAASLPGNPAKRAADYLDSTGDYLNPKTGNWAADQVLGGIESAPVTLGMMGEGLAAKAFGLSDRAAAGVAAFTPSLQQGADSYFRARAQGVGSGTASLYGAIDSATQTGSQFLGELQFLRATGSGANVFSRWLKSQIPDVAGAAAGAVAQDVTAQLFLPENRNKTLGDLASELPESAASAALQTLVGGALAHATMGSIEHGLHLAAHGLRLDAGNTVGQLTEAMRDQLRVQQALATGQAIDLFDKAVAASKLRARDPDTYADLADHLAQAHGISDVYLPADAVHAYQQSDEYNAFEDPLAAYQPQIDAARASGGDLVLPAKVALAELPGTKAWEALRDDARFSPDGMSVREAHQWREEKDAHIAEVMKTLGADGATARSEQHQEFVDRLAGQFEAAGESPTNARIYAEIEVAHQATRAARNGEELGDQHFQTYIRGVLPERLAVMKAADNLDMVIHAMRKGGAVERQRGKSLIQWIADRGGIWDGDSNAGPGEFKGGDFKAMGLDQWHIGKPGQRKAIRAPELGHGGFGADNVLRDAIGAGYFPELEARQNNAKSYDDLLDASLLHDAIGEELGGKKRYNQPPKVDPVRAAARDLHDMLQSTGRDPKAMTDKEIRAAVKAWQSGARGDGYEQAERGPFGPMFRQFEGDAQGAVKHLMEVQDGEAIGALHHPDIGPIDLVWGEPGTGNSDGYGLAKIAQFHPEALEHLQAILDGMAVKTRSKNRVRLESADHEASVRLTWDGHEKKWLLTAYAKEKGAPGTTTNTADANEGVARPSSAEISIAKKIKDYNQSADKGPRGRFIPAAPGGNGRHIIELFHSRNPSTPIHELGHQWLEELRSDATAARAAMTDARVAVRLYRGHVPGDAESGHDSLTFITSKNVAARHAHERSGEVQAIDLPIDVAESLGWKGGKHLDVPVDQIPRMRQVGDLAGLRRDALDQGRDLSADDARAHVDAAPEGDDADARRARARLVADWEMVKDWFSANGHPIGPDGEIPREAHEMWARGIERYFMESKAPSQGLARIMETVRGWMLAIYRKVDALRAPITPQVRDVFDRLLATDDELAAREHTQALIGEIDPKAIGMTDKQAAAYQEGIDRIRGEGRAKLLERTTEVLRRRAERQWREERVAVRKEEGARLDESPVLSALRLARAERLNKEWLVDRMGADVLHLLPDRKGALYKEGGANPDDMAERAGFASGHEMVQALVGAERSNREAKAAGDDRSLRERLVDAATDEEMQRRHGNDPLANGMIGVDAARITDETVAGQLIEHQLRTLARLSGQQVLPRALAEQWAREQVRRGIVNEQTSAGAIARHTRAVAKAGREAQAAYARKDWAEAFRARQRQQLAQALLKEARAAQEEVAAAVERMRKIAHKRTMKSIDQAYLEQAQALMDEVQLGPRTQKSIERQGKWAEWAAAQEAAGKDVLMPAGFEATLKGTHWSRLPVETLLGLDDQVMQIMHLGRTKQTLLDRNEERRWDDVFAEADAAADAIKGPAPRSLADMHSPSAVRSLKDGVLAADAALLRMETLCDWMDGGDTNGVFNRLLYRPIADAHARRQAMMAEYLHGVKTLIEAVPDRERARWNDRLVMPWLDMRMTEQMGTPQHMVLTREQLLAMALNMGNEGNIDRLEKGYRVPRSAIKDYLDQTLTPHEWQFVQGMWDHIGTLWPEIEALEKRVNGVAPEKVEPTAFTTPHGPMRGGYFPAIYDARLDGKAAQRAGEYSDLLDGNFTRANTRAGATKDRSVTNSQPLLLDLGVINRHLAEVIHDITHREAVVQAWKFATEPRVQSAMKRALGEKYADQMRPWVKFVANSMAQERAGNEAVGAIIKKARQNVTMVALGVRATTIMAHTAGIPAGVSVIGERWMGHGLGAMAKDWPGSVKWVMENSAEVRSHLEHYERDIGTMIDDLDRSTWGGKLGGLARDAQKFSLMGIGYAVQRVSVPVYIGAYGKAIHEGMSEADAHYAADKAVRYAVGASAPKDAVAIQRGTGKWGEAAKLMTMFYTAMASQYQRQRTLGRDIAAPDARRPRNMARLVSQALWGVVMVPLWEETMRLAFGGAGPDKEEWWSEFLLKKLFANQLGAIPVARDLFEPTWDAIASQGFHRSPSITPLQQIYDTMMSVAHDIGNTIHGKPTQNGVKDSLTLAGYFTGMVPAQVSNASQFLVDLSLGHEHPQSLHDWINGLQTGHSDHADKGN
jgi:hypothetical protein